MPPRTISRGPPQTARRPCQALLGRSRRDFGPRTVRALHESLCPEHERRVPLLESARPSDGRGAWCRNRSRSLFLDGRQPRGGEALWHRTEPRECLVATRPSRPETHGSDQSIRGFRVESDRVGTASARGSTQALSLTKTSICAILRPKWPLSFVRQSQAISSASRP